MYVKYVKNDVRLLPLEFDIQQDGSQHAFLTLYAQTNKNIYLIFGLIKIVW